MHSDQIKTRPDGSIDTAYYIARSRVLRSTAFHAMTGLKRRSTMSRDGKDTRKALGIAYE